MIDGKPLMKYPPVVAVAGAGKRFKGIFVQTAANWHSDRAPNNSFKGTARPGAGLKASLHFAFSTTPSGRPIDSCVGPQMEISMRSILLFAFLSAAGLAMAQTAPEPAILSLDKLSDHTAQVGESGIFVYQTSGGHGLAMLFVPGGALINSRAMTIQSEGVAAGVRDNGSTFDLRGIGRALAVKSPNAFSSYALLLSVDSDGITRPTLVLHSDSISTAGQNYFYHFQTTVPNNELNGANGQAFLMSIQTESPSAVDALALAIASRSTAGTPVKAQSDFMRIYGKFKTPFKGIRYADVGELQVVKIDGKPGAIRFGLMDGVHVFHASQVEYK